MFSVLAEGFPYLLLDIQGWDGTALQFTFDLLWAATAFRHHHKVKVKPPDPLPVRGMKVMMACWPNLTH